MSRARWGWLGAGLAIGVVVLLLVGLLTHRLTTTGLGILGAPGTQEGLGTPGASIAQATAPADWQTYHDPLGLFTAHLPPGWTAETETSQASFGDSTGSATETTEQIVFSDATKGDAGARVDVNAQPITSDFERHWACQQWDQKDSAFQGIPADTGGGSTWLFATANGSFQIDAWIPGVLEPTHSTPLQLTPLPTATPLPQAEIAADQSTIATILGAIQFSDSTPLSCS